MMRRVGLQAAQDEGPRQPLQALGGARVAMHLDRHGEALGGTRLADRGSRD